MNLEGSTTSFNFQFKYLPVYIIGLYGVILHVLLLIAFIKDPLKCFRNSATYLVANLAVSDLIISLCGPLSTGSVHWVLSNTMHLTLSASIITITSIAADRCLMVTCPFKHQHLMSGKKILILITLIWIMSCTNRVDEEETNVYEFSITIYVGVAFILATGILYVFTTMSLRRQTKNLTLQNESGSNRSLATRLLKEKQFVRTLLLVACITVLGIAPCLIVYHVLIMKGLYYEQTLAVSILWCFLAAFFFFTYATNPLVYFLRLPRYRKTFYVLYARCKSN